MIAADLIETELLMPLLARAGGRPLILGVAGAQGSGKSTVAAVLAARLQQRGMAAVGWSLDDVYLGWATRRRLSATIHPLLATRGVPGSHDLPLLNHILHEIRQGRAVQLPRFDKLADDRMAPQHWQSVPRLDCLILEGWCVGARAQLAADLLLPINDLERTRDGDGHWRRHVNMALAGQYQRAWNQLDALVFLAAPDWDSVPRWRAEQEAGLVRATGRRGMDPAAITVFCAHYERLTRWQLQDTPRHAALTLRLDRQRRVHSMSKALFPMRGISGQIHTVSQSHGGGA